MNIFQNGFILLYKIVRKMIHMFNDIMSRAICGLMFFGQNVKHKDYQTFGIPFVSVAANGTFEIGYNFQMNNSIRSNPVGRAQRCIFFVDSGATLRIGSNVGISQTAIVCHNKIIIGDNVKIGASVCIYDTDFHALDAAIRRDPARDLLHKITRPVTISDDVFVGAHSTILKGVTIGKNSIVGACSVVTKDIPENEIWAGNPARFIRSIV